MANLGEDIVNSILLKLPVKSLLRFKITCKSWFHAIDHPYFINSHLQHNKSCVQKFLFFDIAEENLADHYSIKVLSTEASISVDSEVVSVLDHPHIIPKFCSSIWHLKMSSCSGLVLIYHPNNTSLILWNPLIPNKYKHIPMPQLKPFTPRFCLFTPRFCLAYDLLAEDYKVLCIHKDTSSEIYSVKKQSWRTIDSSFSHDSPVRLDRSVPISLNGAIHTIGAVFNEEKTAATFVVISFRLADEKFIVIPVPSKCGNLMELGVFGDSVSLFAKVGNEISIWSLDKTTCNYITKFPTEFTTSLIPVEWPTMWIYICVKDNGNILWRDDYSSTFIEYDVNTNKYAAFQLKEITLCRWNKTLFVESLISFNIQWD